MLRFSIVLVVGLAVLTSVAYWLASGVTRRWFERDVALRSELVGSTAGASIRERLSEDDRTGLTAILQELTRDERILGSALCRASGRFVASTDAFPIDVSCADVTSARGDVAEGASWHFDASDPGGPIQVAAVPIDDDGDFLVLVHDLGFVARRNEELREIMAIAFLVLAIGASIITAVAARLSWRSWTERLRSVLRGEERRREFQPLLRDVRELARRLASDESGGENDGHWSASRLKSVLKKHLDGDRVIVVANREPYIHEKTPEGGVRVVHPASGLVTALEPVLRACSGVWVAHGGGTADRETVDASAKVQVPPGEESYSLRRVWLEEPVEQGYYYGFSNEGLWPLCHVADARPTFRHSDWKDYVTANERFAAAAVEEAESDDPIILVQDYHLALAPRMIRKALPRATILTFWHTPWPNAERFGICPWRHELIDGLLGSSIIGFHTRQHCNHFLDAVDSFVESRIDRERNAVVQGARSTLVRPYPISIEWPVRWLDGMPSASDCRRSVLAELGLPEDGKIGIGIDRLDYTKGIEERLLAVERLLERRPDLVGRFSFVQLAAPSRTRINRYRDLNDLVEQTADRINARFGAGAYRPIALLRAHHEPPVVYRYYRAADLCYVSSLHDGMNLVAKEFVAAREDERGALVLSCFTGAARELTEALVVNPYDLEEASAALEAALEMSVSEQRERMRAMRSVVQELNVYRWAGRMLVDAAALRRKDRLTGRLMTDWPLTRTGMA